MELVNNSIIFLLEMFRLYVLYKYMKIFFKKSRVNKKIELTAYLVYYIALEVVAIVAYYPPVNILVSVLGYYIITLCYEGNRKKRILTVLFIFACGFVAEAMAALVLGVLDFSFVNEAYEVTVFNKFIIEFTFWMLTLVIGKLRNIKENEYMPGHIAMAVMIVPGVSIVMESYIFFQNNLSRELIAVSMVCVVVINLTLAYLYDSLANAFNRTVKLEVLKREKIYYHKQSEMLKKSYEELRNYRHDMKNRFCVMEQLLENNNYEKVKMYLSEVIEKVDKTKLYSQTDNSAIDSVINYKLSMAEEKGIVVNAEIDLPKKIQLEEDDAIVLIGNLLDNAIEATTKADTKKEIVVDIEYEKGQLDIMIKNTYNGVISKSEDRLETTKSDKKMHGIGIRSVESVLEKYNGHKTINYNGDIFEVKVVIYI